MIRSCRIALAFGLVAFFACDLAAQRLEIPRRHDRPPGPALSPEEAVAKMTVPEGFSVELVAAEPDVVNPVAMAIDERGRFWVTESFEYPRREPGPGRDRIKVLEDTDGDGRVDKTTVFADGLNIPSGIAVGHGGVWVANAPDLLFLQDTDGDLKADRTERIVTGFGRTDTHELPNAFTWGPDGWLYGLNGVFNHCHVRYTDSNPNHREDHPGWKFTCAMWRVHPRTREFQVFAEGTSNPWGIAVNPAGDFFISACVIDHLWHIAENGYYIRQGGPYPPHTWPLPSIVDHKHQKAAYCGLTYFDSDAYPAEYRGVLYMGNIHGGCINADVVEPRGASYFGRPRPDFLTANDAWFMPVAQLTGPDGCLYVLDWYDRYHCYQDANADPEGVDRGKGRLYRVRYGDTPHAAPFDLGSESNETLVAMLSSGNGYRRQTAQRLLAERSDPEAAERLAARVRDRSLPLPQRLAALWARAGMEELPQSLIADLLGQSHDDAPELRAWLVRLAGDAPGSLTAALEAELHQRVATERDPRVLLQAVVAVGKRTEWEPAAAVDAICTMLARRTDDLLLANVSWNAVRDLAAEAPEAVSRAVAGRLFSDASDAEQADPPRRTVHAGEVGVRLVDLLLDDPEKHLADAGRVAVAVLGDPGLDGAMKQRVLDVLSKRIRQGRIDKERLAELREALREPLRRLEETAGEGVRQRAVLVRASWGDDGAVAAVERLFVSADVAHDTRLEALQSLLVTRPGNSAAAVEQVLTASETPRSLRGDVIEALGAVDDPRVGAMLLKHFAAFDGELRPKVIELLTQRPVWTSALLERIESGEIGRESLNLNQLRRIASFTDPGVQSDVARVYGRIRSGSRSDRQQAIRQIQEFLKETPGDPHRGAAVFKEVCAQCHTMHGEGAEVGPDITRNGRNDWNQLLQNVLDPSAVIGPGYQARTVVTISGRVLTGLPVEETDQQVVLKIQGGKTETIPRDEIETYQTNEVSMMPEELESQLKPQQLADLFAYLALDKPPSDPSATILSGAPEQESR